MTLNEIREARATKVASMRNLLSVAETEKRSLSDSEKSAFDKFKTEITSLEADETRASFVAEAERRQSGDPVGDKSFTRLQANVNILEVIRSQMEGRSLSGAAAEFHTETERRNGRKAQGIYVPLAALETRVNTTTSGSDLVSTDHRADQYIEPFRNSLMARRLGVRVLSGLSGNLSVPKYGTGMTSGWVAENAALTASSMGFDSVTMTPKHVGGMAEISRQLIQQSAPSVEQLIRDDLSYLLAQSIDSALIQGGGSNQPTGIIGGTGVQDGTLATLDWASVLGMLEQLALENTTAANWLTSPQVATKLRSTLKSASAGAGYLMDGGTLADLPVSVTKQVPLNTSTGQVILGDFSQAMLGIWSEIDILVNPFAETAYGKGNVLVRAMATVDVALRHPEAFVVANDVVI